MWTRTTSPPPSSSCSPTTTTTAAAVSATAAMSRPITMEEVWKDITLASDLRPNTASASASACAPAMILQDFFSKDNPSPAIVPSAGFAAAAPPTLLTLNSGPNNLASLVFPRPLSHLYPIPNAAPPPTLEALAPGDSAAVENKRPVDCSRNSGDRRRKRMIKNRESAARSRARKQAYTNELEFEVAHLMEENARLREQQQQQFSRAAAAQDEQKKPLLHRTSTAPF